MFKKLSKDELSALKAKQEILILAIETSCDETSAAVILNGTKILSNVIHSQIDIHKRYGGVVPEIASRNHLMKIDDTVKEALSLAGKGFDEIEAVAVTYAPGLIGSLMVGVSYAKGLAYSKKLPLVAVDHIEGHIAACNLLEEEAPKYPYTALVISGGHTSVYKVARGFKAKLLEQTSDDAIGEAFDKVGRILDLPYPGGPEIDKISKQGSIDLNMFNFRAHIAEGAGVLSFSGLKTAVINYVNNLKQKGEVPVRADVAASFQQIAANMVAARALAAAKATRSHALVVCGGVSANSCIRATLKEACEKAGVKLFVLPLRLCTDNAAMIGARAYINLINNQNIAKTNLKAMPN